MLNRTNPTGSDMWPEVKGDTMTTTQDDSIDKIDDIFIQFFNEVEQDVHSDNNQDGIVFTKAGTKAKQQLLGYFLELVGEDEKLDMGGNKENVDRYNINFDRNELRAELRDKIRSLM